MKSVYMSNLKYGIVYSPDDDGYYAEFWDERTGKSIEIDGEESTDVYGQRYKAVKAARQAMRRVLDGEAEYKVIR